MDSKRTGHTNQSTSNPIAESSTASSPLSQAMVRCRSTQIEMSTFDNHGYEADGSEPFQTRRVPSIISNTSSTSSTNSASSTNSTSPLVVQSNTIRQHTESSSHQAIDMPQEANPQENPQRPWRDLFNAALQFRCLYVSRHSTDGHDQRSAARQNTSNQPTHHANTACPTFPPIYPGQNTSCPPCPTDMTTLASTAAPTSTTAIETTTPVSTTSIPTTPISSTMVESTAATVTPSPHFGDFNHSNIWAGSGLQVELESRGMTMAPRNRQISLHSEMGLNYNEFIFGEFSTDTGFNSNDETGASLYTSNRIRFALGAGNRHEGELSAGALINRNELHWDLTPQMHLRNTIVGTSLILGHAAGASAGYFAGANLGLPGYGAAVGGTLGSQITSNILNLLPVTRADRQIRTTEPSVNFHLGYRFNQTSADSFEISCRFQPRLRLTQQTQAEIESRQSQAPIRQIPVMTDRRLEGTEGTQLRRRRFSTPPRYTPEQSFPEPHVEQQDNNNPDQNSSDV